MSTPFSPDLLSRCISCGFCLPACPTYQLTGQEQSSPRGRITLMRAVQSGALDLEATTAQSSMCLGCRACEPVCPAGVEYGTLLEEWRTAAWQGRARPWIVRVLLLAVGSSWRVRLLGVISRLRRRGTSRSSDGPHLLLGCFERILFPGLAPTALSLAGGACAPEGQGCCGALHAHNGELEVGHQMARQVGEQLPGVILTTAGGCAAHLASVLGRERVREFSQWWGEENASASGEVRVDGRRARVGYQDSCHLRNGLGVIDQPRALIASVADFVEISGAGECCGAAGSYALLQRGTSRAIVAKKVAAIEAAGIDYVATTNPGCTRQLADALRRAKSKVQVLHVAELLELARAQA